MERANVHRAILRALIACVVIAAAVLWACEPVAWAQRSKESQVEPDMKLQVPKQDDPYKGGFQPVAKLWAQGYKVVGPMQVSEFTGQGLSLFAGGKKELTFNLTGKDLTVYDKNSNKITSSSIVPKAYVYVCQKDNTVTVFVMPEKSKTTAGGEANDKH
ncbi:MAG: hypothetical protein AB1646_03255 [Thermodesulfobacteriota bacterium]